MAILYVAAESAELKPFARRLGETRKLKWPLDYACEGVLDGRRVMLAANGAGPRLAAQAVEVAIRAISAAELSSSKLEAVVSAGFCGALDPDLVLGEIVIGTAVLDRGTGQTVKCGGVESSAEGSMKRGVIVSEDRVANSASEKHQLAASGGLAVEMEAFGVAARADKAGIPFCCIKVVSDCCDESFGFDLNRMRTTEGRIARGKIVSYALTHPKLIPELIRLRKRSERAAEALGDFLVSCRIRPESDRSLAE